MSVYDDIRSAAELYLSMDLAVIPLCSFNHRGMGDKHKEKCKTPGKAPILKNWSAHKKTSMEQLNEWFDNNRYINVGMVLGQTDAWNMLGVDIDGELGEQIWAELLTKHEVPDTWEFITGGGRRLLFIMPAGIETKKNKICWKAGHEELAFLAQGQQTVMPPSVHPSGASYAWVDERSPEEIDIADAPEWMLKLVDKTRVVQKVGNIEVETNALPSFYKEEISSSVTIQEFSQDNQEGSRSDWMARFVGSLCAKRTIPKETILQTAFAQNDMHCKPPLAQAEIEGMVESIFTSEQNKHQERLDRQRKREEQTPTVLAELFHKTEFEKGVHWSYFVERDQFYYATLEQGPWKLAPERKVRATMAAFLHELDPHLGRSSVVAESIDFLKNRLSREHDGSDFDIGRHPNVRYLVLSNGMLDWESNKLEPWNPRIRTTLSINAAWTEKAEFTEPYLMWQEALKSWIPDEPTRMYLQEYIGYCLIPTCGMRTATFLYGEGANGKSLFIDIVARLFEGFVAHTQPHALIRRFGTTVLIDKTMAICSDIDSSFLNQTGVLKQIIAGDAIAAEYKGGASFDFVPVARLLFSANTLPRSGDKSHGWYSRLKFVPFPCKFAADPVYKTKLETAMRSEEGRSALLAWAVEGLKRLTLAGRFTSSKAMVAAKVEYTQENDSVAGFLGDQLISREPVEIDDELENSNLDNSLILSYVYIVYTEWCLENGVRSCSKRAFVSRAAGQGVHCGRRRVKIGMDWKTQTLVEFVEWRHGTEFPGKIKYQMQKAVMI